MTTAWYRYRNEAAYSQHGNNEPSPEKHVAHMSVLPQSHALAEHAERMRSFRLAHGRIETAKGSRSWLGLLSLLPVEGIAVMLRNSKN